MIVPSVAMVYSPFPVVFVPTVNPTATYQCLGAPCGLESKPRAACRDFHRNRSSARAVASLWSSPGRFPIDPRRAIASADRNASWHLRDGEQRVQPLKDLGLDRHTEHGENRFRGRHAGEMRSPARACNDDLEPALLGDRGILKKQVGRPVGGNHTRFMGNI